MANEQQINTRTAAIKKAQEQAKKDEAAFKAATEGSGGGALGVGGFGAPRNDSTGSRQGDLLRDLYRESGVVFDPSGNVIYNPADLGGAREAAAARAAGRPAPTTTGRVSDIYLKRVQAGGGDIEDIKRKSQLQQAQQRAATEKTALEAKRQEIQSRIAQIEAATVPKTEPLTGSRFGYEKTRTVPYSDRQLAMLRERDALNRDLQEINKKISGAERDITNTAAGLGVITASQARARTETFDPIEGIQERERLTRSQARAAAAAAEAARIAQQPGRLNVANPAFVTREQQQAREELEFSGIFKGVEAGAQGVADRIDSSLAQIDRALNPLPEAFADTGADTDRQGNVQRSQRIKDVIAEARAKGATEIIITDSSGASRTVPIGQAAIEISRAGKTQDITVSANIPGTTQFTLSLTESLGAGAAAGGARPGGEIVDLANIPRQITATDILRREERKTGLDLGILAPVTEFLDRTFELGTPTDLRSRQTRKIPGVPEEIFQGISNYEIGRTFASPANLAADIYGLGQVVGGAATGQVKFKQPPKAEPGDFSNLFNLPVPDEATFQRLPHQRTALTDVLERRPVDFSKSGTQASLAGELLLFGAAELVFRGIDKGYSKLASRSQIKKDVSQIKQDLGGVTPRPVSGTARQTAAESALNPKTRQYDIVPSLLENVIEKPRTTPSRLKITPVKGRPGEYDIESTVPDAAGKVRAIKTGENQFLYQDLRTATTEGKPQLEILGNLGRAEQTRFNLIPVEGETGRFVSRGTVKPDAISSLVSDIVQPIARQRTFTAEQIRKGGPELTEFLFGKVRPGYVPPTTPLSDLLLFETRYSRMVGTRVGTGPALKDVPGRLDIRPEVFRGFGKEKTITTRERVRAPPKEPIDIDEFLGTPKPKKTAAQRVRETLATSIDPALSPKGAGTGFFPKLFETTKTKTRKITDSFVYDVRRAGEGQVDVFTDLTKFQQRRQTAFDRMLGRKPSKQTPLTGGKFGLGPEESKPMTGRASQLTRQEGQRIQDAISPTPATKQRPREDAFGTIPMFGADYGRGGYETISEIAESSLEPTAISSRRPRSGMVERIRAERIQDIEKMAYGGGSETIDPLGQVAPERRRRERSILDDLTSPDFGIDIRPTIGIIPQIKPTTRTTPREKARIIPDITERVREEIIPTQIITPRIIPRLTETPITTTTTTTLLPPYFPPARPPFRPPPDLFFPRGALPLLFPGGYGPDGKQGKKGDKSFTLISVNPDIIGVLEQAGVDPYQTSKSPDIFSIGEERVKRAGRKQQLAIPDLGILAGFERGSKRRAVNYESIRAGRKIGKQSRSAPSALRGPTRSAPSKKRGRQPKRRQNKVNAFGNNRIRI